MWFAATPWLRTGMRDAAREPLLVLDGHHEGRVEPAVRPDDNLRPANQELMSPMVGRVSRAARGLEPGHGPEQSPVHSSAKRF